MSAFFIWLEFGQQPIDEGVARSMMRGLDGFGGDAKELLLNDQLAIGSQTRWSTPEDVGEKQPLFNAPESECFLFDGRIDNRQHLLDELNLASSLSDAELLYAFLARFGDSRLPEVIGPFVFVLFDLAKGQLSCARDTMGGRYLVYRHTAERLVIASTELAFMHLPEVGHRLNKSKIASWLVGQQDGECSPCLQGLTSVQPGQKLRWASPAQGPLNGAAQASVFYRPNPERRIRLETDQQYAAEFRRLLDQAVRRRLRSRQKVGCLLSGGMDSVPITISAAKSGVESEIIAYSWVFDESPEMDERAYSVPICRTLGIQQKLLNCDHVWPQFDADTHSNPLFPFALPYTEFQQHTFAQAKRDQVSVMLSGLQGDLLYETANRQSLDAILLGRFGHALKEFCHLRKANSLTFWLAVKRYLLAPTRILQGFTEQRRIRLRAKHSLSSEWLNSGMVSELQAQTHWLFATSTAAARPLQYRITLDAFAGDDAVLGRVLENKYQIERRYPFRDRELCEFMLAIPTEQLAKLSSKRPIVKRAYAEEFTPELVARDDKTQFANGLRKGILKDKKWLKYLRQTPSYWQHYVKERYISDINDANTHDLVVLWRCAYYNFWHRLWYDPSRKCDNDGADVTDHKVAR